MKLVNILLIPFKGINKITEFVLNWKQLFFLIVSILGSIYFLYDGQMLPTERNLKYGEFYWFSLIFTVVILIPIATMFYNALFFGLTYALHFLTKPFSRLYEKNKGQ